MLVTRFALAASLAALATGAVPALAADTWQGISATPAAPPAAASAAPPASAGFLLAPQAPAPAATGQAAPAEPEGVDETALRYYASQRDTARVAAEIRRIRLRHPDWVPPTDLFDKPATPTVDLAEVWALFGAGRYDEVRGRLEAMRQRDPAFQPPQELLDKLDAAQARVYLVRASDAGDHPRVLAIARNFQKMLGCGDVDVLWRVAAALAATGDIERAFSAYDFVLTSCTNDQERLATVQKASQTLPPAAVDRLIQRGRVRLDGTTEFDPVLLDMARATVGKAIGSSFGAPADATALQRVESAARLERRPDDINLVGWYYYSRKEYPKAAEWFAVAAETGDAKAIEGLALCRREMGDVESAETIAREHRGQSSELAKLWIELISAALTGPDGGRMPEATTLAEFGDVVEGAKSALGAQSIGWWLYNQGEVEEASAWFERSVQWQPSEEGVLGLALAVRRLGAGERYAALVEDYKGRYRALAALAEDDRPLTARADAGPVRVATRRSGSGSAGSPSSSEVREAVALYEAGRYREAVDAIDAINRKNGKQQDLAVLRGWALYKLRDYQAARETFAEVDAVQSSGDSRRALFYADKALRHPIYR